MVAEFNPQFQKIGEILVHAGKIDENKLNSALAEQKKSNEKIGQVLISMGAIDCLLYTSPSPRDRQKSRMPSSA